MKIYIDADGCPVVDLTVSIAKKYGLEVFIVKNYAHEIRDSYATVVTVDISPDSADYYIVNQVEKDDIVISQDYGVAAMALSKGGFCVNQNGLIISSNNIDGLLNIRHVSQKLRRQNKHYSKTRKRSDEDNVKFEQALEELINDKYF